MRREQHVRARKAFGGVELPARQLDQEPERVLEIDGVEDHPVAHAGALYAARIQALNGLHEDGARNVEGHMMHTADVGRRATLDRLTVLAREHGDEPPVSGIEINVALARTVEIGLLENEGHAEHALPEVDRRLAIGADQRDVMQTLGLKLLHRTPP